MVLSSPNQNDKLIKLLEEQLKHSNRQIEALTEQVRHLTKLLYGSKTEQSKYNLPDGQTSLFDEDDDDSFNSSEHTEEQSQQKIVYTVERKAKNRKRNDFLADHLETEIIHHHPEDTTCDCCQQAMIEMGSTIVREEAMFIPATIKKIQHVEHAYECKNCKGDYFQVTQSKSDQELLAPIQRRLISPSVLAKVIYDKFTHYLPLYRQVKEWERCGLFTNYKNLSNWVIRTAEDWLFPVYQRMKEMMMKKS